MILCLVYILFLSSVSGQFDNITEAPGITVMCSTVHSTSWACENAIDRRLNYEWASYYEREGAWIDISFNNTFCVVGGRMMARLSYNDYMPRVNISLSNGYHFEMDIQPSHVWNDFTLEEPQCVSGVFIQGIVISLWYNPGFAEIELYCRNCVRTWQYVQGEWQYLLNPQSAYETLTSTQMLECLDGGNSCMTSDTDTKIDMLKCARQCHRSPECQGFLFTPGTEACELQLTNQTGSTLTDSSQIQSVMKRKEAYPEGMSGPFYP